MIVTVLYWWTLTITLAASGGGGAETAFYYGTLPPVSALGFYDRVVVDPAAVTPDEVRALAQRSELLVYVSVGEVAATRGYADKIDPSWILGENSAWGSQILDIARPEVRAFLLGECARLHAAGFEGFFFDTLDSPIAAASNESERAAQIAGLVALIEACRAAMPETRIVVNRGFPVIDECPSSIDGVVAESLFRRWNPENRSFEEVPADDRTWLRAQLERIQTVHGIPITVIDYVPASRRDLAVETARAIDECGFDAWVSVPELDTMGVGEWIPRPRRVVTICTDDVDQVPYTSVHGLLGHVLDYYGLTTRYVGPATLPRYRLSGRAAGVVVWLDHNVRPTEALEKWLLRQIADGVPVAFVGQLADGWSMRFLDQLGFSHLGTGVDRPVRIDRHSELVGFEKEVRARSRDLQLLRHRDETAAVFRLADARDRKVDAVGFPSWGGFALHPYVLNSLFDEQRNWCLDPYRFIQEALRLQPMPILDVTTENGSRLLLCHIDGDGAANRGEWPGGPHAIEVIRKEILEPYPVPTAVSLVEGETSETGVYRAQSSTLEAVAEKIFELPHIELATHTYSHPFKWLKAERSPKNPRFRLPIPGYAVDMYREIVGSARYIESVAGGDASLGLVLWSGDALPSERVLRI
ncbi:MAG: endo alpha-1,4 polygalactosaminidase, partial [Planctomycetota bacterium]